MIELVGVTKQYNYGARVLGALDFKVADGEILSVLGGAGSGKTSLMKVMAGVTECEGKVLVDGEPISKKPDNVQFVFDDLAVFGGRTFFYNLAYPLRIRGVDKDMISEAVNSAARALDVVACLDKRVKDLPLIDVKRLAIARLLLRDARNILIDDISSGLSAGEARELWAQLAPILIKKAEQGATVIYSTTERDEALSIADRIAVMSGGELKQIDTPANIYEHPASIWAAQALDRHFHFERATLNESGGSLVLQGLNFSVDVTRLKDRIPARYIGADVLAGWRSDCYAYIGDRNEQADHVVREDGRYAHYCPSGAVVMRDEKQKIVCTSPLIKEVLLFDVSNENSILM